VSFKSSDPALRAFDEAYDRIIGTSLDEACAQRDALHDALSSLVAHVRRIGGYATQDEQNVVWRAMAVLEETRR
jgi:hypothetical protein